MARLSDIRVIRELFFTFVIQALSSQSWLASTINGNFFFTVHVHNGLVRRKAILFFSTTTRCSSMQSELGPSDVKSNPVIMEFDLSKA